METFWLCFVPLFIAVDPIGVLPLFVSLTEGMERIHRRRVILQSIITASTVGLIFLNFGPTLLRFLGITVPDFMIAGGVLLLAITLSDLLTGEKRQREIDAESLGAVPIGIPLICGPAVLTTSLLLVGLYGRLIASIALLLNVILTGLLFIFSQPMTRVLGKTGTKTVSKIAGLLLAAIAVMLIRKGVLQMIGNS